MADLQLTARQQAVKTWFSVMRDILAFIGGMFLVGFEAIVEKVDRPWLLAVAVGMMGIPFAARIDQWLKLPGSQEPAPLPPMRTEGEA